MIIDANELAGHLHRKLQDMQEREASIVIAGCPDWATYQNSLGFLKATQQLATWLSEVVARDGAIEGMK